MKRILGLLSFILVVLALRSQQPLQPYIFSSAPSSGEWISVVHSTWNSVILWRIEGQISALISMIFGADNTLNGYGFALASWFVIGMTLLIGRTLAISRSEDKPADIFLLSITSSLLILSLIYGIFGYDIILLSAVAWLPWLILSLLINYSQPRLNLGLVIILAAVAFKFTFCALSLSLPLFLFVAPFTLCCSEILHFRIDKRIVIPCLIIAATPLFTYLVMAPVAGGWNYPEGARVISDTGVPGLIRPFVGSDPGLHIVDRLAMRHAFARVAVVILGLGLLLAICTRPGRDKPIARFLAINCLLLSFLSVLDLVPREEFSQIAPLSALTRLLPDTITFGLAPICITLSVILLVMWVGVAVSARSVQLLFISCCLAVFSPRVSRGWALDYTAIENLPAIRTQLVSEYGEERAGRILASPSYALLKRIDLSTIRSITTSEEAISAAKNSPSPRHLEFLASAHQELVSNIRDADRTTRWSTQTGSQIGSEWLVVQRTANELAPRTLVLYAGAFHSDFPRGLRFSVAKECSLIADGDQKIPAADWTQLTAISPWFGPVLFSKSGFPYLGPQAIATVKVPENMRCILIEQIGSCKNFDWSVAELRLTNRE